MVDVYVPDGLVVEDHGSQAMWVVHFVKPDGTGHRLAFPASTPHIRCAEYGFDPADPAAVLHLILHEQFIRREDPHAGANIYAMSAADALDLHRRRITRARLRATIDHQHPALAPFYAGHGLDADSVAPFVAHVERHRRAHAVRAAATAPRIVDGRPVIVPPTLPRVATVRPPLRHPAETLPAIGGTA